jgi:hypothetical protein
MKLPNGIVNKSLLTARFTFVLFFFTLPLPVYGWLLVPKMGSGRHFQTLKPSENDF